MHPPAVPLGFRRPRRSLFDAHFVEGSNIGDPSVLDALVTAAGAPADSVRAAVDGGELRVAVQESMEMAREHDVTGTPSWLLDGRLLIPGVLPRHLFERAISRLTGGED